MLERSFFLPKQIYSEELCSAKKKIREAFFSSIFKKMFREEFLKTFCRKPEQGCYWAWTPCVSWAKADVGCKIYFSWKYSVANLSRDVIELELHAWVEQKQMWVVKYIFHENILSQTWAGMLLSLNSMRELSPSWCGFPFLCTYRSYKGHIRDTFI